jgi:hypothetical protein
VSEQPGTLVEPIQPPVRLGALHVLQIRPPRLATIIGLFFAAGAWHAGLSQLSDNSFFCHLRTGEWMLANGIPHHDLFSFVSDGAPWVSESWLADALYGLIQRWCGPLGLRFLTAAISTAIALIAYRLTLQLSQERIRAMVLMSVAAGASFTLWSARPLLLGLLAFIALLYIVEGERSRFGRNPVIGIPPLMWLWANVHGTFLLGFGYIALHCAGRWIEGASPWRFRERQIALGGAIGLALCMLNPYGIELLLAPFKLIAHHNILSNVIEWQAPNFRRYDFHAVMYCAWLITFTVCALIGPHRISRRDVLISVPFLVLGLWAQRNILMAPLITLPIAARAIATTRDRPDSALALNWGIAALVMALATVWTAEAMMRPDFDLDTYPVAAMTKIEREGLLGGRLLSTDHWNGYIILYWWPRQYIFMDDRYAIYPASVGTDLVALSNGQDAWHEVLTKYNIDVVVWPANPKVIAYLSREPGWTAVYRDRAAVVFATRTLLARSAAGVAGKRFAYLQGAHQPDALNPSSQYPRPYRGWPRRRVGEPGS